MLLIEEMKVTMYPILHHFKKIGRFLLNPIKLLLIIVIKANF